MTSHKPSYERFPTDTARPATLWILTCSCGWRQQYGIKRDLRQRHLEHLRDCLEAADG